MSFCEQIVTEFAHFTLHSEHRNESKTTERAYVSQDNSLVHKMLQTVAIDSKLNETGHLM